MRQIQFVLLNNTFKWLIDELKHKQWQEQNIDVTHAAGQSNPTHMARWLLAGGRTAGCRSFLHSSRRRPAGSPQWPRTPAWDTDRKWHQLLSYFHFYTVLLKIITTHIHPPTFDLVTDSVGSLMTLSGPFSIWAVFIVTLGFKYLPQGFFSMKSVSCYSRLRLIQIY